MSLTVKYLDVAKIESEVDIASCLSDEDYMHVEFAKIISENTESDELEEIEVRSKLKIPIKNAAEVFAVFGRALIKHEIKFKDGNGLALPESDES